VIRPTSALVSVSDSCEVSCGFCFRPDRSDNTLSVRTLARILSRVRELGIRDICFTGGEPTDHPDFETFCKIAIQFGLSVSVVTAARTQLQVQALRATCRFLSHITFSADSYAVVQRFHSVRTVSSIAQFISSLKGPTKSIHVTSYQLTEKDLHEIEEIIRQSDGSILVEISPLMPGPRPKPDRGASFWSQFQRDLSFLQTRATLSDRLSDIMHQVGPVSSSSRCAKRRVYVSAAASLRVCPYIAEGQVSLLDSRQAIKTGFHALLSLNLPLCVQCAMVCR
jgi:organic radical activating enzyme